MVRDKVVLETDSSGVQTAKNTYGLNLLTRTVDGETLTYMYNGHADVTSLLNSSGAVVGTYYYDAFGVVTEETGTANNPIRYAGYQYDEETGNYYLNARYYRPDIARFLQEDTYRGQANDPLSLNLYTYVSNNPLIYHDPTGHYPVNVYDVVNKDENKDEDNDSIDLSKLVEDIKNELGDLWDDIKNTFESPENAKDTAVGAGHSIVQGSGELTNDINYILWYYMSGGNTEIANSMYVTIETEKSEITEFTIENFVENIDSFEFGNTVADVAQLAQAFKAIYDLSKSIKSSAKTSNSQAQASYVEAGTGAKVSSSIDDVEGTGNSTLKVQNADDAVKSGTQTSNKTSKAIETQYAKTSFWERFTTKKVSTDKLVGNPKDEFMNPKIGPSDKALSKHMKYIQQNGKIDEPILVKKLQDGTYEIQNGHHRWLAAQKMGLEEVPVEVMK